MRTTCNSRALRLRSDAPWGSGSRPRLQLGRPATRTMRAALLSSGNGRSLAEKGSDKDSAIGKGCQPNLGTAADDSWPSAAPTAPNITVATGDQANVGSSPTHLGARFTMCARHRTGRRMSQLLDYRESVGREAAKS